MTAGFGANTGLDAAGVVFGLAYQSAAESLLKAAAAVINACRYNGVKVELCASNYSIAEAASLLGGGGAVLAAPAEPVKFVAPGPPGTLGPGEPPPLLWAVVESLVGDLWPDGDAQALHAAAAAWRGFEAAVGGAHAGLNSSNVLIGAQQIAEGELIHQALSRMGAAMEGLGEQCGKMAATLDDFANEVARAQNAIRDLLHRLGSVSGLWHEMEAFLVGDALDEVRKVADDIKAVLHNLGREARAVEQMMQWGMEVADGLVVGMEKYVRDLLTHFLGEQVGNPVATVFDTWINSNEGAFKSAFGMVQSMEQLDPRWFLIDPVGAADTWKDATRTGLINHFLNPHEAAVADQQMLKSVLHLEDWRRDRPGLGFGGNLFDVATLFAGGEIFGAGAKGVRTGVRGAEAAGDAIAGAGRGDRVTGEIGAVAGAGSAFGDIGKASHGVTEGLKNLTGDLAKADPHPGGSPAGMTPAKQPVPVESTPRPIEPSHPAKASTESPTAPRRPAAKGATEANVGPHEPVAATTSNGSHSARGLATQYHGEPSAAGRPPATADHPRVSAPYDHFSPTDLQPGEHVPVQPSALSAWRRAEPPQVSPPSEASQAPNPTSGPTGFPSEAAPHIGSPDGGGPGGHTKEHALPLDPVEPTGGNVSFSPHQEVDGPAAHPIPVDGYYPPHVVGRLTSEDLSALADYTGSGYLDLNSALRTTTLDASQYARIGALNQALEKLPVYEGTVVRGSDLSAEVIAQYKPGEIIIEKAFMSTSTDPEIAQSATFAGNVEFRILSKTGRNISSVSMFPNEQEILFPAGTKFFVLSKTVDQSTGKTIIDMMER
ncbi:hypothetical protein BST12_20170 [Mycobacterium angelicum]|uniref:Uncharacterized protein n=1 Tax=Mycobacterium angelicum TaxID=470074 RepID=A0A1W9ZJS7_MYCAN|nr:hypothetical protein BST12_20170 [Mycobacterium angelicum]